MRAGIDGDGSFLHPDRWLGPEITDSSDYSSSDDDETGDGPNDNPRRSYSPIRRNASRSHSSPPDRERNRPRTPRPPVVPYPPANDDNDDLITTHGEQSGNPQSVESDRSPVLIYRSTQVDGAPASASVTAVHDDTVNVHENREQSAMEVDQPSREMRIHSEIIAKAASLALAEDIADRIDGDTLY